MVTLVSLDKQGRPIFHLDKLESILSNDGIRTKKVVGIANVGNFCSCESSLHNLFLCYMRADRVADWIGDGNVLLNDGAQQHAGTESDSAGIYISSEPFLIQLDSSEEAVLLFLEARGCFRTSFTAQADALLFALSVLLSSKTIFNVDSKLQEEDLLRLQYFVNCGKFAAQSGRSNKPFQVCLNFIHALNEF